MDLTTLLAALLPLSILVYWFTDTVKDVTNRNYNGLLTRVVAVGASFGAVALYAHSSIDLGGTSHAVIAALSTIDQLLVCLLFAATGGAINDTRRTLNRSDASVASTLVPLEGPAPNQGV